MLDSWPSSTTVDAEDAMHGDLSSTWSSVQRYTQEEYAERSPEFVPTPAGMDVRASKSKHISVRHSHCHIPNTFISLKLASGPIVALAVNNNSYSYTADSAALLQPYSDMFCACDRCKLAAVIGKALTSSTEGMLQLHQGCSSKAR